MKSTIKTALAVILLTAIFFPAFVYAQQQPKQENAAAQFSTSGAYDHTKLIYKIIDAPNHTYGYDVLADDRLIIHQESIPAMPGNEGFKIKADAGKVAELVISKIKEGEMLPTVTIEENEKT